jgi:hypothetical protein
MALPGEWVDAPPVGESCVVALSGAGQADSASFSGSSFALGRSMMARHRL